MADTKTGGIRMKKMLESGKVSRVGQCIDLYNQEVVDDIFVTITTRIDACNHYWVVVDDMRKVEPLNPDDNGLCRTLKAQYAKNGFQNFFRDGSYAATGVIEFNYEMDKIIEPQVLTPKRTEFGKQIRKAYEAGKVKLQRNDMRTFEPRQDGISNTITTAEKDNILLEPITEPKIVGYTRDRETGEVTNRHLNDVANTVHGSTGGGGNTDQYVFEPGFRIRKLTEREVFRLQGVSDDYIDKIQSHICKDGKPISRSRQYAMAGNSIVVDVLESIFTKMFVDKGTEDGQLSLF